MNMTELKIFDSLSIVVIRGFEPNAADSVASDLPGDANWLVSEYGMMGSDLDPECPGVIWTDYDTETHDPWRFAVLVATDEVDGFVALAEESGYDILGRTLITEPRIFGDGNGVVTIMQHPDGWVLAS